MSISPPPTPSTNLRENPVGRGPGVATFVIVGAILFFAMITSVSSGFGGFLSALGVAAIIAAIVALARGGIRSLALRTRPVAVAVLAVGFVTVMVGGGVQAATQSPEPEARPFTTVEEAPEPVLEPVVKISRVETQLPIPFGHVTVEDAAVAAGTSFVSTVGVEGVLTVTFEVTTTDGVETSRVKIGETVTLPGVDEVTTIGTKVEPAAPVSGGSGCDPNYSGCVPIASDVDCAGGSGNGPAYAIGPVNVIGSDIYDLDRDGDGVACD